MQLAHVWSKFRALPLWAQIAGWVLLAPLVGALGILARNPRDTVHRGTAAAVLVAGGFLWTAAYAGAAAPAPANDPVAAAGLSVDDVATEGPGEPEDLEEGGEPEGSPTPRPVPQPSPTPKPSATPSPAPSPPPVVLAWAVTNVVDGDTIDVRATNGTEERVRIIGIDTPERGECGFEDAAAALSTLVMSKSVELAPGARDDRDRYDRVLRYVDVNGVDAGLDLIGRGLAIARYDSRDGYGAHPREASYVAADVATDTITCAAPAPPPPPPAPEPEPDPEPEPEPEPAQQDDYYENCTAAREAGAAPVRRGDPGYGKHLDRDGDGIGCE